MRTRLEIASGTAISSEDFRNLPESNQIVEHIEGVVIVSPSPTRAHQRLILRTYEVLKALIPSGEVFVAPLDVYLGEETVQPDVFWVAPDSQCQPTMDDKFIGPPDLIVVLSSNESLDRVTKFDLYERFGVREYWLLGEDYLEVYVLENGAFRRLGAFLTNQNFRSSVLNKTVNTGQILEI